MSKCLGTPRSRGLDGAAWPRGEAAPPEMCSQSHPLHHRHGTLLPAVTQDALGDALAPVQHPFLPQKSPLHRVCWDRVGGKDSACAHLGGIWASRGAAR